MKVKHLDVKLNVKTVNDDGTFSGYGSVFDVKDSYGDIVIKGAFANTLKAANDNGVFPAMLWQHDTKEPIGVYTKMQEDEHGLYVEGRLLIHDDPLAKRAHAHLKAGSISGLSIGFTLAENGYEYNSEKDAFILKAIDLWELSIVTFPANDQSRVTDVKSFLADGEKPAPKLVERLLRDAGFSRQQAKGFMAKGYSGLNLREADDNAELVDELHNLLTKLRQSA